MAAADRNQILHLTSLEFVVTRLRLNPTLHWNISRNLGKNMAAYPITRFAVKTFAIAAGNTDNDLLLWSAGSVLPSDVRSFTVSCFSYGSTFTVSRRESARSSSGRAP